MPPRLKFHKYVLKYDIFYILTWDKYIYLIWFDLIDYPESVVILCKKVQSICFLLDANRQSGKQTTYIKVGQRWNIELLMNELMSASMS